MADKQEYCVLRRFERHRQKGELTCCALSVGGSAAGESASSAAGMGEFCRLVPVCTYTCHTDTLK